MEPLILCIETSTRQCSVALGRGAKLIGHAAESNETYIHAERLLPLIDEVLSDAKESRTSLNAVVISAGPGSYTGLRIGTATAKGLCHALGIPLIAIDTLELLARQAVRTGLPGNELCVTVLDARREEVFTATYACVEGSTDQLEPTRAVILDEQPFEKAFPKAVQFAQACVIGDAVKKTARALSPHFPAWTFHTCYPDAQDALIPGFEAFNRQSFADVAYFEPQYLKDFIAGKAKDPFGLRSNPA